MSVLPYIILCIVLMFVVFKLIFMWWKKTVSQIHKIYILQYKAPRSDCFCNLVQYIKKLNINLGTSALASLL